MVEKVDQIFRDFVTDGVPASGKHKPKKHEIRAWGRWIEDNIKAGYTNGGLIFDTKANLNLSLAHDENASAWVVADGANNGIYRKIGASGTGSWTKIAELPYSVVYAQNAGTGTADAVEATSSVPISTSPHTQLISVPFTATNTAAMTLSINGETPRPLVTNVGAAIPAGYVQAGMAALVQIDSDGNYRLFSYGDASAIQAAAEAAQLAAEAAQLAAEAARDIAAGYASDAVSQGNVPIYATALGVSSLQIPIGINGIRTNGYAATGDGGGALYKRVETEPSHPGKIQSGDGIWWELVPDQQIRVEMFGAITGLNKANTTANDAAFANADAFMAAMGGGTVYMPGQFYCLTKLRWSPGVYFEGSGYGRWMPSLLTISKTWEGTNLIACGTGARDYTIQGITSMKYAGGWRVDPDNASHVMKLNSFMNDDASGATAATLREMSVFVANRIVNSDGGGVRRCRIVPWIGTDGISDYSDSTNESLGDDWDVGLLLDTAVGCSLEDVQVRGYWRMIGFAWVERGLELYGRSEGNVIRNVSAQGLTGVAVRAGDIWRVLSHTANTLTIRWSEESYWPSSGAFEGGSGTDYTYSSLSRDGDNLVFQGVSPNITSEFQIRNLKRGWGFSTSIMENVEGWGWRHHSGKIPDELGLDGATCKGAEFSGFPLRGLHAVNFTSYGDRMGPGGTVPCCIQFHDADDLVFLGGKFETGFVIGSPHTSVSTAVAPAGATLNLRLVDTYFTVSTDVRLLQFQGGNITMLQQNPWNLYSEHNVIAGMPGQNVIIKPASGRSFQVHNQTNQSLFTVFEGSGNTEVSGILRPKTDDNISLGTPSLRWKEIYAGTGTISTSDEREKQQIQPVPDEWLDAWADVNWVIYKWNGAVEEKGLDARWHVGLIAQRIRDAFAARGLDAFEIGLLCYDEWDEQAEISEPLYDADGNEVGRTIIRPHRPAGNRFGVRYEEALALEAAWQRREIAKLRMLFGS